MRRYAYDGNLNQTRVPIEFRFSGGFNRIINTEDAANLTIYDLTNFFINDNSSDKSAIENKYLLCKRTISIRDLTRKRKIDFFVRKAEHSSEDNSDPF